MNATPEELALIDALIDKELDGDDAARAARLLEERTDLKAYAEQQRRLKSRLDAAFSPIADAEVPAHLIGAVRRSPMPVASARPSHTSQHTAWRALPVAAAVVLSLGLGLYLGRMSSSSLIGISDGTAIAQGSLAKALTSQLAADNGPIAIGLSFQDKDGRMCRTFAAQALAGIACREADGWLVTDLTKSDSTGSDPTKFETAGAALPQHLRDRVKDVIRGDVLDAAGERAARDRGWRSQ